MGASSLGLAVPLLLILAATPIRAESPDDRGRVGASSESRKGFGASVRNLLGIGKKRQDDKTGSSEVPSRIAVLQAVGDGEEEERRSITEAVHNSLGTSQFSLLKPYDIQRRLDIMEARTGVSAAALKRNELADALQVDGLLLLNVDRIGKLYVAAYAHYEIEITVRLYSRESDSIIWEHADEVADRDGGISLNPLDIIATAVTSADVLSEAGRLRTIAQLARKIAKEIPEPLGNKVNPPQIQFAMSNALEGPFRAGDELKVWMQADPELIAQFVLPGHRPVAMMEEKPGEYAGRYVVGSGDELDDSIVEIQTTRLQDKAKRQWLLPGRISFDTRKPGAVGNLTARAGRGGMRLKWSAIDDHGTNITYRVERADVQTGKFTDLADAAINTYLDPSTEPGMTYVYRIAAVDAAGNSGGSASVTTTAVRPGPTLVSGDILSSSHWAALGSPYKLSGRVAVRPGVELTLEPGTIVEFAPRTKFQVDGHLYIEGSESASVRFSGNDYVVHLRQSGLTELPWRNLIQSGRAAKLHLERVQLHIDKSDFSGLGVILGNGSRLTLTRSVIANADTAVRIDGGQLYLDGSKLMQNRTAIDVERVMQQPAVAGRDSALSHNQIHVRTSSPLTISGVALTEIDLDAARAKMKGPVSIDWQSLSGTDNLESAWIASRQEDLISPLQKRQWSKALKVLRRMKQDDGGKDLLTLLTWLAGEKRPSVNSSVSDFLLPVREEALKGTPLAIWLRKIEIPSSSKLLGSDLVMLKQATNGFARAYLAEHFSQKRRTKAFRRATRLPLHKAIVSSKVEYRHERGLASTVWVCHVVNRKLLDHQLSVAGLLDRGRADFVLAVAIDGNDSQILKSQLFRLLDQQNVPFIDMSGLTAPQRIKKARKQAANLLLSARVLSTESVSNLSESIKVIEMDMDLKLEEVRKGGTVGSYHRETRTTAFKKQAGLKKAITKSLQSIKGQLLADLFSYSP